MMELWYCGTNNMQLDKTISTLRQAAAKVKLVKQIMKLTVEQAQMLMDDDKFHEMKELAQEISADAAVLETHLNEFERFGAGSKRFAITKQ